MNHIHVIMNKYSLVCKDMFLLALCLAHASKIAELEEATVVVSASWNHYYNNLDCAHDIFHKSSPAKARF